MTSPFGDYEPPDDVPVQALDAPVCRRTGHELAYAWRVRHSRYWTCAACHGPPADERDTTWGQP